MRRNQPIQRFKYWIYAWILINVLGYGILSYREYLDQQVTVYSDKRHAAGEAYDYLIYLPESYDEQDSSWPLMLFLHGSGQCGGDLKVVGADVRFTVYPDAGHNYWDETYATPELYAWLLQQSSPSKVTRPQKATLTHKHFLAYRAAQIRSPDTSQRSKVVMAGGGQRSRLFRRLSCDPCARRRAYFDCSGTRIPTPLPLAGDSCGP